MIDTIKGRHEERRRIKKLVPDQGVFPVRIDHKTVIYIKKGQDPEERKRIHIENVDRFRNSNKD
jgi:hypothetical protein